MAESVESDLETLRTEVRELREDLSKINETLMDIARRRAGEAYEGIQESAEKFRREARHAAQSLTEELEARPLTTAVTAFAVGVMLGVLVNSRSHNHH